MDRPATIREIADEIERILDSNEVPQPNPDAVSAIRRAAVVLQGVSHYSVEKAAQIEDLAQVYYSARKHDKYPGGAGAAFTAMKHDLLGRIRKDADMFENSQRNI